MPDLTPSLQEDEQRLKAETAYVHARLDVLGALEWAEADDHIDFPELKRRSHLLDAAESYSDLAPLIEGLPLEDAVQALRDTIQNAQYDEALAAWQLASSQEGFVPRLFTGLRANADERQRDRAAHAELMNTAVLPHLEPATREDYLEALARELAAADETLTPVEPYMSAETFPSGSVSESHITGWWKAVTDFTLPPGLHGAWSLDFIVPAGVRVFAQDPAHCEILGEVVRPSTRYHNVTFYSDARPEDARAHLESLAAAKTLNAAPTPDARRKGRAYGPGRSGGGGQRRVAGQRRTGGGSFPNSVR